jgi:uncharacterized iron-regulated protein
MDLPALALAFGVSVAPMTIPTPIGVPMSAPAAASAVYDSSGAPRTWDDALSDLATARVVAVGESHDDASHHRLQAEVLTALASRVPLAVAFEMVCYEDQAVLDAYMAGTMSEPDFAVWWKKNWGYDFSLYEPIFAAAKAAKIRAYGINAPIDVIRKVGKAGIAALSAQDRARIPASIQESGDSRYRDYVRDAVSGHGAPPAAVGRMIEAMSVWNETMGEKVSLLTAEGRTVLVIAGEGHVLYKAGLIESAALRGAAPAKVLLPMTGAPKPDELALSDWFRIP